MQEAGPRMLGRDREFEKEERDRDLGRCTRQAAQGDGGSEIQSCLSMLDEFSTWAGSQVGEKAEKASSLKTVFEIYVRVRKGEVIPFFFFFSTEKLKRHYVVAPDSNLIQQVWLQAYQCFLFLLSI